MCEDELMVEVMYEAHRIDGRGQKGTKKMRVVPQVGDTIVFDASDEPIEREYVVRKRTLYLELGSVAIECIETEASAIYWRHHPPRRSEFSPPLSSDYSHVIEDA